MERITEKKLKALVIHLNEITGSAIAPYTKKDGKFTANPFNYHLSFVYGGVSLHRFGKEGNGIQDIFSCGHVTKRDLYERIHAYMRGMQEVKDNG